MVTAVKEQITTKISNIIHLIANSHLPLHPLHIMVMTAHPTAVLVTVIILAVRNMAMVVAPATLPLMVATVLVHLVSVEVHMTIGVMEVNTQPGHQAHLLIR